jgi:hypothetical protein
VVVYHAVTRFAWLHGNHDRRDSEPAPGNPVMGGGWRQRPVVWCDGRGRRHVVVVAVASSKVPASIARGQADECMTA